MNSFIKNNSEQENKEKTSQEEFNTTMLQLCNPGYSSYQVLAMMERIAKALEKMASLDSQEGDIK